MKTTVRRLKLTHYELRILIEALNAKRLKQWANGIDNTATSGLILRFIDVLEGRKGIVKQSLSVLSYFAE